MATVFRFPALTVAVFALLVWVRADDQPGFISIDCGTPENYTDEITGIRYVPDTTFIDTGEIKAISPHYRNRTSEKQFWNLRSFPEGDRNCYTIRPPRWSRDRRYLIRVRFMYGNYDNNSQPPIFDLFLGVDRWDSVNLQNASNTEVTKELIHVPPLDYMQICLINTKNGVPFISALEVRPLHNATYVTDSGSLKLQQRLDFGLESNRPVRYADDQYDRIWSPYLFSNSSSWKPISIKLTNNSIGSNRYAPPSIVLATAITPKDNKTLQFTWKTDENADQFYIYMHFAEIEILTANQHRAFNISVNGRFWFGPLDPTYLSTSTVFSKIGIQAQNGRLQISINRTENSTLPPLINAIEIFVEKEFPQLQTNQAEVDTLLNIKSTYNVKKNWQGDPCYPRLFLWAGLDCSYEVGRQPNITSLNLSSSGLIGQISPNISELTMTQYLDLSNNSLNGTVPDFLANMPYLTVLNLENNNLSGTMPLELIQRSRNGSLSLSAGGNPHLCLSESCSKKEEKYGIPLVASLSGVTLLLLTGGGIFWSLRRQKKQECNSSKLSLLLTVGVPVPDAGKQIIGSNERAFLVPEKKQFTYSEILSITNNFERVIGKGGFGTVYHGYWHSIQVSVKMLSPASVQVYKQFQEEAQLLTGVHHGNLTYILGYCDEDAHLGLVYEYMENGNLADHLSGKSNHILNWKERLRIAQDVAQGLEYLHFGCKPPIIHTDVKSTNILLDGKFNAKLVDFGMSKVFRLEDGAQAFAVVGTPGYLDPEYTVTDKLSEKSDVYSFGVILLEIITGRLALTKNQDKTHVIEWVSSGLEDGEIKNIVDPKLELDIDNSSIWKLVELAMTCVSPSSSGRPTMTQVVMELKQCLAAMKNSQENNHELVSMGSSITHFQER